MKTNIIKFKHRRRILKPRRTSVVNCIINTNILFYCNCNQKAKLKGKSKHPRTSLNLQLHIPYIYITKSQACQKLQCVPSETQPETILSSIGFKLPHDLATDSKSFSISGAHLMKDLFQKLYLGF